MTPPPSATPGHVWVDGAVIPAAEPVLTAFDRGFQLGDGIFETLRARAGRPTELPEHAARLGRSAAGLGIPLPEGIETTLAGAIDALLATERLAGADGDASIRITVSRGAFFGRGLLPPDEHPAPTIVVRVEAGEAHPPRRRARVGDPWARRGDDADRVELARGGDAPTGLFARVASLSVPRAPPSKLPSAVLASSASRFRPPGGTTWRTPSACSRRAAPSACERRRSRRASAPSAE